MRTFNSLFARLQLQARLRDIEQALGWDEMLRVLASAVEQEFARHDHKQTTEKSLHPK